MVKKFFKYGKLLITFILITSFLVPTYAVLPSSDGSAFVTKAEFDSALAEFSARLTVFEAGINSKIDSQVTTYLDRNGIWSAKNQTLATSMISWDTGDNASSLKSYIAGFNGNNAIGNIVYVYKDAIIVNEINKSGLLCADMYSIKGDKQTDGTFIVSRPQGYTMAFWDIKKQGTNASWDSTSNVSIANRGVPFWRGIYYIDGKTKSTFDIGTALTVYVSPNQVAAGAQTLQREFISYVYQFKEWTQSIYFFVSKGDKLQFRIEIGYQGAYFGTTGYGPTQYRSFDSAKANLVFEKLAVY